MKKILPIFTIIAILLVAFLAGKIAFGAFFPYVTANNGRTTNETTAICQIFTATSSVVISGVAFSAEAYGVQLGRDYQAGISTNTTDCIIGGDPTTYVSGATSVAHTDGLVNSTSSSLGSPWLTIPFSSQGVISAGGTYALWITDISSENWRGSIADILGHQMLQARGGMFQTPIAPGGDTIPANSAFQFEGSEAVPTISLDIPVATTTPQADFNNWILSAANLVSTTTYTVNVKYALTPINSGANTDSRVLDPTIVFNPFTIPKSHQLAFPTATSSWVATTTLVDNSNGQTISTTTTSFVILSQQGPVSQPSGTSTLVATCDPASGFFANSTCNVFVWLFYPSQDAFNAFSGLKDIYGKKPPFGYFTSYQVALNNLALGTSTIVLMDASSTAGFSGIFSPIRTGFNWLVPFLFSVWVIVRMKHLEL